MRYSKHGFTLIELIIVIVIIGVLASIAAPMMQKMSDKAIVAEVITMLGSMRTAERMYYTETGSYGGMLELKKYLRIRNGSQFGGVYGTSDYDGVYFSYECYNGFGVFQNYSPPRFLVGCRVPYPDYNVAAKKSSVPNWTYALIGYIAMDQDGKIYSDVDGLGYPRATSWSL